MAPLLRHLVSTSDLSLTEVDFLLDASKKLAVAYEKNALPQLLKDKIIGSLFFETSDRTRTSFDLATRSLGGQVFNFSMTSGSTKGESLSAISRNIEVMKANSVIIRHSSAGAPHVMARKSNIPIINAGDGFHEHPTHALLDVFTIHKKLGSLKKKHVLILGDVAHSRVARSNISLMKKMGAKVSISGPPTLLPPNPEALGAEYSNHPDALIPDADVILLLRLSRERNYKQQVPSLSEYSRFWGMTAQRAKQMKPGAIIIHPGPILRGIEMDAEVADGPQSMIYDQAWYGVVVRMAALAWINNPEGLNEWLKTY